MLTMFFLAQALAPATCAPAGSTIRVEARAASYKPADVTYVVDNRRRERLRWVRVSAAAPLVVDPSTRFFKMPLDWQAKTQTTDDGARADVEWKALTNDAEIGSHARATFRLRGAQRFVLRSGQQAIDFTAVPFAAGDDAGHCWSGITDSSEYSETGVSASIIGATVRVIPDHGTTRILAEFPAAEFHLRINRQALLVVPLAVTWGVKGGFSVDGSIGIGLSWLPTKYVSAFVHDNIGTLLFNNVTHLRTAGVDFNIPIGRTTFAEGLSRQNRFLTVGIEYLNRDVSKLAGFLDGPQWYASGRGIALRVGIRKVSWDWGP